MTDIYGLMVAARPYRCGVCGHEHSISTNHTGPCVSHCPGCSWRSGYDAQGRHYRADTDKLRPHTFCGGPDDVGERNPHAAHALQPAR